MNTLLVTHGLVNAAGRLSILAVAATLVSCAHVPRGENTDLASSITAPIAIHTVAPEYPYWLRRAKFEGSALLRCVVDENGLIHNARVLDASHDDFANAALAALSQWRFAPGTRNGRPAPLHIVIPFEFALEPDRVGNR